MCPQIGGSRVSCLHLGPGLGGMLDRNGESERGADAQFGGRRDRSTMALGDVFEDGQPQPGTAGLPGPSHLDATEAFEDTVDRSSRDPRTGVGDRPFDGAVVRSERGLVGFVTLSSPYVLGCDSRRRGDMP